MLKFKHKKNEKKHANSANSANSAKRGAYEKIIVQTKRCMGWRFNTVL